MNRIPAFIAALAAALLIVWAIGHYAVDRVRVEPAPVFDVQTQFPDRDENESAARFYSTTARLDLAQVRRQREAAIDYIAREVTSPSMASAQPPAKLAAFLDANAPALHILRAQLASNPVPLWKLRANDLLDTQQPDYILMMQLSVAFAADALAEHSRHHDAGAWADLEAINVTAQSLWSRPELTSVLTALNVSRLITAIATKLPPPAPPWWAAFVARDPRAPLLRSLQYEAWAARTRAERYPAGEPEDETGFQEAMRRAAEPFVRPLRVMEADSRVSDFRELMREIMRTDPCTADAVAVPRWTGTIARFNRFIIEREGVTKLLDAESGKNVDPRSACRAAHWVYSRNAGGFELTFTAHIPAPQTRMVTPLTFRR